MKIMTKLILFLYIIFIGIELSSDRFKEKIFQLMQWDCT